MFFSMIMSAVILFMIVIYTVSQTLMAGVRGRQAMDVCAKSTMAGYVYELYREYGLFALLSDASAEEDLTFFLQENLAAEHVRDITYTSTAKLTDTAVFEGQIREFMEYRMPLRLIEQYSDLLDQFQEIGDVSKVIDQEISLNECIEQYAALFSAFITALEGVDAYGGQDDVCVKKFWDETWSRASYQELLAEDPQEKVSAVAAWRERTERFADVTEEALEAWTELQAEGRKIRPELEEMLGKAETEDQKTEIRKMLASLHTGQTEDQEIQKILAEDLQYISQAEQALSNLLDEGDAADVASAEALLQYRTDLYVAYELHPIQNETSSWRKLWRELQDYVTDLSSYVGKETAVSDSMRESLPSHTLPRPDRSGLSLTELSKWAGQTLEHAPRKVLDRVYTVEYATGMFQDLREQIYIQEEKGKPARSLRAREKRAGVFLAEQEYLLIGHGKDLRNCQMVRLEIIGLRMLSNLWFLSTNAEKKEEIKSMSAVGGILAPGWGDLVLGALITAIWAGVESLSDYEILIHGGKVPVLKTARSWHTDLKNLSLKNWKEEKDKWTRQGSETTGLPYEDHIKILLYCLPKHTLNSRIMDLIQLNLSRWTGVSIRLDQMPVAFRAACSYRINGRKYQAKGEYGYT
ncbi:MAG: DUF5702 domain-containing protein [Clostridiales bacterium]|nr:DUF5702 domain-containing protein [Clostridiales bacterium]